MIGFRVFLPLLALLASVACGQDAKASESSVRGVLVESIPRTFNELEAIQLRTDDGTMMRFRVLPEAGLTPSHAREHMVLVEPVTVFYRAADGELVAHLITD